MKSIKFFISLIFLLAFGICATAQKPKPTKKLDSLDLINMNNKSENLTLGFLTPNELEGYEFFRKGRLNKIRLGISTGADITEIFGSDCKKPCDYDSNWRISVDYFNENLFVIKNLNKSNEKQFVPKKEVIGKIHLITLHPKKSISFENIAFSGEFKKYSYLETGNPDSTDKDGVLSDIYADLFGLRYIIFDNFTSDTFKDTFNLRKNYGKFRKRDLITIQYALPEEIEKDFFIEDK